MTNRFMAKWPGVFFREEHQFGATKWMPPYLWGYIKCANDLYDAYIDLMDVTEPLEAPEGWPKLSVWYGDSLASAFKRLLPGEEWTEEKLRPWVEWFEELRKPKDVTDVDSFFDNASFYCNLFSLVSGNPYADMYVTETDYDTILTMFYPTDRYTDVQLQEECVPEYFQLRKDLAQQHRESWEKIKAQIKEDLESDPEYMERLGKVFRGYAKTHGGDR